MHRHGQFSILTTSSAYASFIATTSRNCVGLTPSCESYPARHPKEPPERKSVKSLEAQQ